MTDKAKKPAKKTKQQLARELKEAHAARASNYHFADATLDRAINRMASGVILELTALGGAEIIPPIMIPNGLSESTVAAIRADIARAWNYATELTPAKALAATKDSDNA